MKRAFLHNAYYHGYRKALKWWFGRRLGRVACSLGWHDFSPHEYRCRRWPCPEPNREWYENVRQSR